MKRALLLLVLIACLAAGCSSPGDTGTAPVVPATQGQERWYTLNESIRPGDDFYTYVNDAWIREHPVPADKTYIGHISELGDKTDVDLDALMTSAANQTPGSADRNLTLIGQFYRSGMDTGAIEREGLASLAGDLAMIDAIRSRDDLSRVTVVLVEHGSIPLYYYQADVNPKNTTEMVPFVWQGGLGLPDRDYYTRTDNESVEIQQAYRDHIRKILVLSGEPEAQAAADAGTIYALEKSIALGHFTNVENRDRLKLANIFTREELNKRWPSVGFDRLAAIPGSGPVTTVMVCQPQYLDVLEKNLESTPLEDWKVYLRYRLVNDAAPYLGSRFEEEDFQFYSRTLNGVPEMKPRWKRVVWTVDGNLGDLVGQEYVARYVDPRTKGMVSDMFVTIRQTFDERIENLTWMSPATKVKAREKLAAMGQKIAYPDTWMDYSGLALSDSYNGNVRAASAYNLVHGVSGLDKIGGPVNHDAWFMSPQTVNAYYSPERNEMVFPAGILQPPFFDPDADPARNYGGIGLVISHELTHGFDDQGRQSDKDGNLVDWWTGEDAAQFESQAAILVDEYNRFEVLPDLYLNGNLTLGENIADFGGTTISYHAWKKATGGSAGSFDHTRDREFFYAVAQVWSENAREEAQRNRVYTDPHSVKKFRVNGPLFNVPEFYEAFPEIQPGDALYRNVSQRPVIW